MIDLDLRYNVGNLEEIWYLLYLNSVDNSCLYVSKLEFKKDKFDFNGYSKVIRRLCCMFRNNARFEIN